MPYAIWSGGFAVHLGFDAITARRCTRICRASSKNALPAAVIAHRRQEDWTLDLDALFEAALAPSLALPGGGSIHIAETRAATLVDVDTGTPEVGSAERTALAVNIAAAQAIARRTDVRETM